MLSIACLWSVAKQTDHRRHDGYFELLCVEKFIARYFRRASQITAIVMISIGTFQNIPFSSSDVFFALPRALTYTFYNLKDFTL